MLCDIIVINDVSFEHELALLEEATKIAIDLFGASCTKDEEGEDLPLGAVRVPHLLTFAKVNMSFDIGANKILILEQKTTEK